MRGRSRDRHNDRPIQSRQSTLSHGRDEYLMEEMNLGPGTTPG